MALNAEGYLVKELSNLQIEEKSIAELTKIAKSDNYSIHTKMAVIAEMLNKVFGQKNLDVIETTQTIQSSDRILRSNLAIALTYAMLHLQQLGKHDCILYAGFKEVLKAIEENKSIFVINT